jgi:hypothetical protein
LYIHYFIKIFKSITDRDLGDLMSKDCFFVAKIQLRKMSRGILLFSLAGTLSSCLSGSSGSGSSSAQSSVYMNYPGATSAMATSTTCATIAFNSANSYNASLSGVNIYASARSGPYVLKASVGNGITSFNVCGLLSGTSYNFRVNPVASGIEYPNFSTVSAQTISVTSTAYQNVLLVQAFGDAPNAPLNANGSGTPFTVNDTFIQPSSRIVNITWLSFAGATYATQYALVRTGSGNTLDATTTTPCTNALLTSCLVCSNQIGLGSKTCSDSNIAAAPQVYDYTVVEYAASNWPEETPIAGDNAYRITVPIPPLNMSLTQRDSANYQMCSQMGKQPIDPLNHQRCPYNGRGAVPFATNPGNSALNLNSNFYDFGYNLFVDRWDTACNWTRAFTDSNGNPSPTSGSANSINCTGVTNATAGNCYGSAAPVGGTSSSYNAVFYNTSNNGCYLNKSGTWTPAASLSASADLALLGSNDPGAYGGQPPLWGLSPISSNTYCNTVNVTPYGKKRAMRIREYMASSEFQVLGGDPAPSKAYSWSGSNTISSQTYAANNAVTSAGACQRYYNISSSGGIYTSNEGAQFNSNNIANFATSRASGYEMAGTANAAVVIGASGTRNCVSRTGMQEPFGGYGFFMSDEIICSSTTVTCQGITSLIDSANTDISTFTLNGIDGVAPILNTTYNYVGLWYPFSVGVVGGSGFSQGYGAGYFNYPLGIPLVSNSIDNGNDLVIASTPMFNDNNIETGFWGSQVWYNNTYYTPTSAGYGESRLGLSWGIPATSNQNISPRCVLPAQ